MADKRRELDALQRPLGRLKASLNRVGDIKTQIDELRSRAEAAQRG